MTFWQSRSRWHLVAIISFSIALFSLFFNQAIAYDPWCWILWGRETIHGNLNTDYGPSWKPLPMVITIPAALFGSSVSPLIWLFFARAGTVAASCLAFVITKRFSNQYAGLLAALIIMLSPRWFYQNGLGNSEGIMVFLALLTFLWSTENQWGKAFFAAVCVSLLRPEAWPFLGLYTAWLWHKKHVDFRWLVAGLLAQPLFWFGPEFLLSGDPFRASERARIPPPGSPALASRPAFVVFKNVWYMTSPIVVVGSCVLIAQVKDRKLRPLLIFLSVGFGWLGLVMIMTEKGYSGNERYGLITFAFLSIAGAVGLASVVRFVKVRLNSFAAVLCSVFIAVSAATVLSAATFDAFQGLSSKQKLEHSIRDVVKDFRYRQNLQSSIGPALERAGGSKRLLRCGKPVTEPYFVPYVAWYLRVHVKDVGLAEPPPVVLMRARQEINNPPTPPLGELAKNPQLKYFARYRSWEVVGVCR